MQDDNSFHSCSQKFRCLKRLFGDSQKITENICDYSIIYSSNMPQYLSIDKERELISIANCLLSNKRCLLAIDESPVSMLKILQPFGLENTEENRRLYRQILLTKSNQLSNYLSGIILCHETFYQTDDHDKPFRQILNEQGILIGIKVDKGLVRLNGINGENITQGLDGLHERCGQYYRDGARFAKWRCALKIADGLPSQLCIQENSNVLARYASICQQNGLVPIIECEILVDGDHELDVCQYVTEKMLASIVKSLHDHHVFLEGILLQPNMITSGSECKKKYTDNDIAKATVLALRRTIPPAVPGICFLSGNQTDDEISRYFYAINQYPGQKPWILTLTHGRMIQINVLSIWSGKIENVRLAQEQLLKQVQKYNAAAQSESHS